GLPPHLVHGLSHMLLAGYKHYSYEAPLWLDEGLAHWCEREVDPESNTFDADEGTLVPTLGESDWEAQTLRVLARGKAEPLANLVRKNAFADLDVDDHVVCWSKVDFLLRTRPKEFAALLGKVKGRLDAKGYADARDLTGAQRDAFRELLGWSFAEFDREWEAWVRKTYPAKGSPRRGRGGPRTGPPSPPTAWRARTSRARPPSAGRKPRRPRGSRPRGSRGGARRD
ncbi:MAG: hypothetical protein ACREIU_12070, partial [Planctomycetota bacterium]